MITFIYAQDMNGGIGYQNNLPWYLPNDLKHFKRETMGHTIVMGRKTFESMGQRLLPGRRSVVVTRQLNYGEAFEDLTVLHDVQDVLQLAQQEDIFIIGGAELFKAVWPYVDRIIRTVILEDFPADIYLPEIDEVKFTIIEKKYIDKDKDNAYSHEYQWWIRNEEVRDD
ncbi:dihydrofolate reductase [Aerococcaceae bacterium DSM 111020]|nr:dihydrofolate reductase [Aerococcaceae bacterium DSM 111020]